MHIRDKSILFANSDLDSQLRARLDNTASHVEQIPKDQFLVSSDSEIIEYIRHSFEITPLTLHEELMSMEQTETSVDVSRDTGRYFRESSRGPILIPGTRITISIPFSGDAWIFKFRTNPYFSMLPRGEVLEDKKNKELKISLSLPHDADPKSFKSEIDQQLNLIRQCIDHSSNQINRYNESLSSHIQHEITDRRQRLQRHGNLAEILDIPLARKAGAPSPLPVKLEIKQAPKLPIPPKSGLKPEPGISEESFENILRYIRHQGRTFERTPATFAIHGEEELRDIILAQLNGHFEGNANGEAFRNKGKTDICIEESSRAAFVGECKVWTGPESLHRAASQLLSYLTWRDSKAALILFNTRNKDFSSIISTIPDEISKHSLFIQHLSTREAGEHRVQMHSAEDNGRRVTIHIFAFNIFASKKRLSSA